MLFNQIITSLLENDLYKFSMGQAIYHQFPDYKTTWTFKCRNNDVVFTRDMVDEIREQVLAYCDLRFTEDELAYLDNIKWIKGSYVDFLRLWHPNFDDFDIKYTGGKADSGCGLEIETRGTWLNTSMYEIPVLAIVNEVFFRMRYDGSDQDRPDLRRTHGGLQGATERKVRPNCLRPLVRWHVLRFWPTSPPVG